MPAGLRIDNEDRNLCRDCRQLPDEDRARLRSRLPCLNPYCGGFIAEGKVDVVCRACLNWAASRGYFPGDPRDTAADREEPINPSAAVAGPARFAAGRSTGGRERRSIEPERALAS